MKRFTFLICGIFLVDSFFGQFFTPMIGQGASLGFGPSQVWAKEIEPAQPVHSRLFLYQKEDSLDTHYISNGTLLFEIDTSEIYVNLRKELQSDSAAINFLNESESLRNSGKIFEITAWTLYGLGLASLIYSIVRINNGNGIDYGFYWAGIGTTLASLPFAFIGSSHKKQSFYNLIRAMNTYNGDEHRDPKVEPKVESKAKLNVELNTEKEEAISSLAYGLVYDPSQRGALALLSWSF